VEGDSAGGSAKQGRDRRHQAILPLRGKILNVEKARFDKMLQNEEIKTIVTALGTGIGEEDYDISKLRYNKIILMTDADVDGLHIRTLLLTFFFRQIKEVIERGYLYIAQPPLFRIADGKKEFYCVREEEMRDYVLKRGVEKLALLREGEDPLTGNKLLMVLKKVIRMEEILDRWEGERLDRDVIRFLAGENDVTESLFRSEEAVRSLAERLVSLLKDTVTTYEVLADPDHGGWKVMITIHRDGNTIICCLDRSITKSPIFIEAKSLAAGIAILGSPPFHLQGKDGGEDVWVSSLPELIEGVTDYGKRGITIQRYKGLGEMNPEQLWETTMNPEKRTLLKVCVEDAVMADEIFTTLMGDQVEPRKEFIYRNALKAANLDV